MGDESIRALATVTLDARSLESLGPQTLETCVRCGVAVLAFESGRSLLLEQEVCAALADRNKLAITTVG